MLFLHQMEMFLPPIIKAHYCTARLFSTIRNWSVLVLPMPFFSIYKRSCCKAIAVTCTGFLYVAPLPSSKCLTSLKGLPLVLWPAVIKSYVNGFIILSEFRFLIGPVHSCQSGGGEEDAVDDANTTQRSGLLAAAQPIKRGRAQSLLLVFSFLIILLLFF